MMLKDLRDLSRKYDCDTAGIIKAIDQYSDVAHLKSEISSLGAQKLQLEESIDKLQRKLGRLTGLSKISEAFLTKFNFNLYDLDLIYEVATSHGDPSNFFRALARITNLQKIEEKIGGLQNEKVSLELNIVELEKTKLEFEQTMASLGQTAKSVMENISSGVGNIFQEVADKVTSELDRTLAQLRNSYDEYSLLRAKMRSSKERLRVCRVMRAVMYNDVEAIQTIPRGYLSIFIQGALNLCYGKYLNPSTDMPPSIAAKYQMDPTVDFELVDLLELAKNAIQAVKA
jgi:predicted  nucleic acid-binding Zn-ribbon protein